MDRDKVGVGEQLVQLDVSSVLQGTDPFFARKNVEAKHFFDQSGKFFRRFLSDQSGSDDTDLKTERNEVESSVCRRPSRNETFRPINI